MRVGRWLIYGLLERRTGCLFYVGKTHKRREHRLREHLVSAKSGSSYLVHQHIKQILAADEKPEIFVLERIDPTGSWRDAEKHHIHFWRNFPRTSLPVLHPAQTRSSHDVWILDVDLKNVRAGG